MEQAKLVRRGRPYLSECSRVKWRAIGEHLIRLDACLAQSEEETLDLLTVNLSMDELVTHQPIAARNSGIHGQQQCQLVLVDLIYAQNPGELLENPGLVVSAEVHALGVLVAPAADHRLARGHPEVPGEPLCYTPEGHPILVDGEDSLLPHPLGVDGIGAEKWRLNSEVPRAGAAAVDAHGDQQEHRMIQIYVYGRAGGLPDPPSGLAALLALGVGQAVADMTDRTGSVVEGRKSRGHGAAPGKEVWTGS